MNLCSGTRKKRKKRAICWGELVKPRLKMEICLTHRERLIVGDLVVSGFDRIDNEEEKERMWSLLWGRNGRIGRGWEKIPQGDGETNWFSSCRKEERIRGLLTRIRPLDRDCRFTNRWTAPRSWWSKFESRTSLRQIMIRNRNSRTLGVLNMN